MTTDPEDVEYELVMPFVVVTSKGGPYDDEAFTAGWQLGGLDEYLSKPSRYLPMNITVPAPCVPQVDLIAMRNGCRALLGDLDDSGTWRTMRIEQASDDD